MTENKKLLIIDWLTLACITAVVFLQRYYVLSSDPLLAWPITDSIAHPERYSSEDILIQAGVSGNFLLYHLLAYVPLLKENFPLRDFLLYVPIYFFTLLAWWKVFTELGASRAVATMSILLLVCSDDKLALNWAHVVPAYFISATSVQFLQIFGLLWFLKSRRNLALSVTALSGYFHPATALSFGVVYCVIICYDAIRNRSWSNLSPVLLFTIIFVPNVLVIVLNSQGSFAVSEAYFEMFERYQPQAFLGDHFRMGYAYTLAVIAFVYRYHTTTGAGFHHKREIFLFIAIGLAGCVMWLANLYSVRNLQFIQTFFLMRMFSLIHPLLVFLIVATAVSLYASSKSFLSRAIVAFFLLSPLIYFSPPVALIIVASCAAYAFGKSWWPHLFGILIALYLGTVVILHNVPMAETRGYIVNARRVGNEFNWFQAGVLLTSVAMILRSTLLRERPTALTKGGYHLPIIFFCAMAVVFLRPTYIRMKQADFKFSAIFNFNHHDYWGVRSSAPAYAELLDWVRQSPDKLFSVPPYDDRFLSFRYLSGKGVYIFHRDIAQLMYSPTYYVKGIHRLTDVAGNAPYLPKSFMNGEVIRTNGQYEANCRKLMASGQFDAIIFERKRLASAECLNASPVFQNDTYVVFRTATVRSDEKRESRNDSLQ